MHGATTGLTEQYLLLELERVEEAIARRSTAALVGHALIVMPPIHYRDR